MVVEPGEAIVHGAHAGTSENDSPMLLTDKPAPSSAISTSWA
jgi:hypothetical protein